MSDLVKQVLILGSFFVLATLIVWVGFCLIVKYDRPLSQEMRDTLEALKRKQGTS